MITSYSGLLVAFSDLHRAHVVLEAKINSGGTALRCRLKEAHIFHRCPRPKEMWPNLAVKSQL